jgi:crotonobetainyl-CoA:carnitine CoA-transferase CaiB-like acyl-CoA transferase
MVESTESMLSPYRVLDLTDEKGLACGKLLGDLGADVIKIEPPGGDPARRLGPFFHDQPHPEKSLYWFAFNLNKRGITLNLNCADGQKMFKQLVKTADFVIESFPAGYMESLGLDYPELEKVNPGVIVVSITLFGQSGPYGDYRSSDIVAWALGGHLYLGGDADRPPVGISEHTQSYLHAGAEAAAAATMALYARRLSGEGQQISVSIQECVAALNVPATAWWSQKKAFASARGGERLNQAGNIIRPKVMWKCKDGWISCQLGGGPLSVRTVLPLMEWMKEKDMLDDFLKTFDWVALSYDTTNQEVLDKIHQPITKFFESYTMAELLEEAIKRGVMIYPLCNVAQIAKNDQLANRDFWSRVEHPELAAVITYPGAFIKSSETPLRIRRRAPLIGEHNQEIYENELEISKTELVTLNEAGVI